MKTALKDTVIRDISNNKVFTISTYTVLGTVAAVMTAWYPLILSTLRV